MGDSSSRAWSRLERTEHASIGRPYRHICATRHSRAPTFSVTGGESLRGCFDSQEVVGANSRVILTLLAKVSPTGEDRSHLSAR